MKPIKLPNSPVTYFISRTGQAEWILFIHAAFVDHNMFNAQFAYFENTYNILAVDIIGHGQSMDTQKGDTIDKMSKWVFDILKAEHIDKVHIAGVSLGAVLAQDFANCYPYAVRSLACFGAYDINNFDAKLKNENSAKQKLMMLKAFFSVKWFAEANKEISAYTSRAQDEFFAMNVPDESMLLQRMNIEFWHAFHVQFFIFVYLFIYLFIYVVLIYFLHSIFHSPPSILQLLHIPHLFRTPSCLYMNAPNFHPT